MKTVYPLQTKFAGGIIIFSYTLLSGGLKNSGPKDFDLTRFDCIGISQMSYLLSGIGLTASTHTVCCGLLPSIL